MEESRYHHTYGDCNSMPWDEIDDALPIQALQHEKIDECSIDGCLSNDWRRIGLARRKFLLEDDRRKGGTNFDLNISCTVDRYFQVAHRALEQFHWMYQDGSDLEETYIMGNRMVTFLTECLPTHPGFHRPAISQFRRQLFVELDQLQRCLEDVALKIDEEQCDKYADDFDPHVDSDSEDEDTSASTSTSVGWAVFPGQKDEYQLNESPTSTVNTTGTASLDSMDGSSSDDDVPQRRVFFADIDLGSVDEPSFMVDLSTDFLDMIAGQVVDYEVDSEAADSWAQGDDSESYAPSMSSGQGVKCDPARTALRQMSRYFPKSRPLSPTDEEFVYRSALSRDDDYEFLTTWSSHDSLGSIDGVSPREFPDRSDFDGCIRKKDANLLHSCSRELAVAREIQRFLDASFEYDPQRVFDSSMEEFKSASQTKAFTSDKSRPAGSNTPYPLDGLLKNEKVSSPSVDAYGSRCTNSVLPRSYRVQKTDPR